MPSSSRTRSPRTWLRWPLRAATIAIALYLIALILIVIFEERIGLGPTAYPEGTWNPPGVDFEDVPFLSTDGTSLHGWYIPAENPRGYLLYAHGSGGNLSDRWQTYAALVTRFRFSVFAFDYRGYGRSKGTLSESGFFEDARAAQAWLAQKAGIKASDVIVLGESLGGGVAVDLAAREGARALILENTFSSLTEVVGCHLSIFPVNHLLPRRFDSARKIGRFQGPMFQMHGDADTLVPLASASTL